jgi:hypothetical protein
MALARSQFANRPQFDSPAPGGNPGHMARRALNLRVGRPGTFRAALTVRVTRHSPAGVMFRLTGGTATVLRCYYHLDEEPGMIGTAYVTTSTNPLGADAGITVYDGDTSDEVARETVGTELDGPDGALDYHAADALLKSLGFERFEPWRESGGQWAAEVESA